MHILTCNNWWKKSDTPYFKYFYILGALINFLASMHKLFAHHRLLTRPLLKLKFLSND